MKNNLRNQILVAVLWTAATMLMGAALGTLLSGCAMETGPEVALDQEELTGPTFCDARREFEKFTRNQQCTRLSDRYECAPFEGWDKPSIVYRLYAFETIKFLGVTQNLQFDQWRSWNANQPVHLFAHGSCRCGRDGLNVNKCMFEYNY